MFWKFGRDDRKYYDADWEKWVDLEQIICPADPGHQRGGARITQLGVTLPRGKVPDVFWVHDCVIQDHVLKLFQAAGLTGFNALPVKARFKRGNEPPPVLWELGVTG